jgi:hypothetical protein
MKKTTKPDPIFIARQRVGDYFPGLSPKTLANLAAQNKGPKFYKPNRIVYYALDELKEFLTGESGVRNYESK